MLQSGCIYCQGLLNGKDVMVQGQCTYCRPSFSPHIQWRNMRQSSGVSQHFNETTGLGSILAQVRTSRAQLLILIVKFMQYYRKAINLEQSDNGIDGVLPNSRLA